MFVIRVVRAGLVKRQRGERALRASEERFRLLSDAAPVMIWSAGPDKQRTDGQSGPCSISPADRWRQNWEMAGPKRSILMTCAVVLISTRGRSNAVSPSEWSTVSAVTTVSTGGSSIMAVPRFTANGGFAGYSGAAIDVTELKLASEALSRVEPPPDAIARSRARLDGQGAHRGSLPTYGWAHVGTASFEQVLERERQRDARWRRGAVRPAWQSGGRHSGSLGSVVYPNSSCSDSRHQPRASASGLSARHGITIDFRHEGVPDEVPDDVALALFRVLEEALGNAFRHAAVHRVARVAHR